MENFYTEVSKNLPKTHPGMPFCFTLVQVRFSVDSEFLRSVFPNQKSKSKNLTHCKLVTPSSLMIKLWVGVTLGFDSHTQLVPLKGYTDINTSPLIFSSTRGQ